MSLEKKIKAAGWSPTSLLAAMTPSPLSGKKREHYDWLSTPTYEKIVDLKETPTRGVDEIESIIIDLTLSSSPIPNVMLPIQEKYSNHKSCESSLTARQLFDKNTENVEESRNKTDFNPDIKLLDPLSVIDNELPNGWVLFHHQKLAVLRCYYLQRSILALDMGLGKTLVSLVWSKLVNTILPNCMIIVIAPCTLLENWRREAEMLGFTCFDRISNCPKNAKLCIYLTSWARIPSPRDVAFDNFLVICDEAHAMQSLQSQRTRLAIELCTHVKCKGCILSTGTPMKNGRPSNLFPLLAAIRHPIARNKLEFEKRYCNARKTKFCLWDITGAKNLQELKMQVGDSLIRMVKEDCLDSLPVLKRNRIKLNISENDMLLYTNVIKQYKARGQARGGGGGAKGNSTALEMMSSLRQLTSLAKVEGAARMLRSELSINCRSPVVVFVWFKETASRLKAALARDTIHIESPVNDVFSISVSIISGDSSPHERQMTVDSFQNLEIDVLICTYGVGATGLTLTASHTVMLLDRPWTPGDVMQAEDRVRRIGQKSCTVCSIWLAGFPFDDSLDKLLQKKDKISQEVIEVIELEDGSRSKSHVTWFEDSSNKENNKDNGKLITTTVVPRDKKDIRDYFNRTKSEIFSVKASIDELQSTLSPVHEWNTNCYDEESRSEKEGSIINHLLKDLLSK